MEIKKISLDPALAQMLQVFATADLRHEVLITAMLDILTTKKNDKGEPLITRKEIEERAAEIQKQLLEESKIAKPNTDIILPKSA